MRIAIFSDVHGNLTALEAVLADIEGIYNLVDYYAERGLILPRSRHSIFETLRDFTIAEQDQPGQRSALSDAELTGFAAH